ncbi:hypothetical protein PCARR_a2474 [Pseudoalteromonas carrageenovora IAM 12662]|uniref:Uncharacterized protein n=1 Tax=Pseudoalteromonas carrageenovora IAM 12662 TaxID=1314868 RepID=A0ABR9EJQ9_PSEVC|nr:hypothetical protein [Pseudoalteromonas carrageenovora IAM 12662]
MVFSHYQHRNTKRDLVLLAAKIRAQKNQPKLVFIVLTAALTLQ